MSGRETLREPWERHFAGLAGSLVHTPSVDTNPLRRGKLSLGVVMAMVTRGQFRQCLKARGDADMPEVLKPGLTGGPGTAFNTGKACLPELLLELHVSALASYGTLGMQVGSSPHGRDVQGISLISCQSAKGLSWPCFAHDILVDRCKR